VPAGEERRLVVTARAGNDTARADLVTTFLPSIRSVARRYRTGPSVSHTELMQEGVVGLLRAVERFDADRGTPFWAYASWWVRQAMQDLVSELGRPVVLSDRAMRQLARVRDARTAAARQGTAEPTAGDLAASTGLPTEHVERLIAVDRGARALAEPVRGAEGGTTTLGELVPDPRAEDEYDQLLRRLEIEDLIRRAGGLGERELQIVRERYGMGSRERSRQEIAGSLNLSAERVRQIEQGALEKLRLAAGERLH
jgi:RNA polymerase sigma factor (sigma-70 family)